MKILSQLIQNLVFKAYISDCMSSNLKVFNCFHWLYFHQKALLQFAIIYSYLVLGLLYLGSVCLNLIIYECMTCVKLWFSILFYWLQFCIKFDCNFSIIYMYVCGVKCNGFSVKLVKNCEDKVFCNWLTTGATYERPSEEHMLAVQKTQVLEAFREWLVTWPTCDLTHEMHGQLYVSVFLISLPTLKTLITHEIVMRVSKKKP